MTSCFQLCLSWEIFHLPRCVCNFTVSVIQGSQSNIISPPHNTTAAYIVLCAVVQILHHQSSWKLSGGVGDEIWCLVSLSSSSRRSLVSFASVIAMQITLCNSSTVITTAIQLHMKSKHTFTTNMLGFLNTLLLQSRVPSPSKRSLNWASVAEQKHTPWRSFGSHL